MLVHMKNKILPMCRYALHHSVYKLDLLMLDMMEEHRHFVLAQYR